MQSSAVLPAFLLGSILLCCVERSAAFSHLQLPSLPRSHRRPSVSVDSSPSLSLSPPVGSSSVLLHRRRPTARRTSLLASTDSAADAATGTLDKSPFFITTPIYYVNDAPHIGHAYTTVACDVIARFMRLDGREVCFLTGTDEHGQKVQEAADRAGRTAIEFCDDVSETFRQLTYDRLNCTVDRFIRTTEEGHRKAVQHLWRVLEERGHIYLGAYEGWYSVRDEAYFSDSELVDGKAPTGAEVIKVVKEPSYFFRLSEWQDALLRFYEENPDFLGPWSRKNEVISFVKEGLRDLSISRTSFQWGVRVPESDEHVVYVWLDALTNYLTAVGYPDTESEPFRKYWPASLHVVGKDILRFHAIMWPAFLLAAGIEPPKRVFAHGWWTRDGQKISKSVGNVIDPIQLVERYGLDAVRYFMISEVAFGQDGDYSDTSMANAANTLANDLGNLLQRTLTLVYKNCDKQIPQPQTDFTEDDQALLSAADGLLEECRRSVALTQGLHHYAEALIKVARQANKYIESQAPWQLKKTDAARMTTVLFVLCETLRRVAVLFQPIIPLAASQMLDQLGVPTDERAFDSVEEGRRKSGVAIDKPSPVFRKMEIETGDDAAKADKGGREQTKAQKETLPAVAL
ncbi:unnamed protein product [Vitrella brassicaformis CCMP3155]|uniref:methionine--tRNA ligase n=3 Tax=Vitrella brassicaformis TaxID=1169539 RepID=A0A0G4EHY2_VITBC|nr:unnamed protein product [Vitrella brassicaformis CCMP3155]|eukprot:CEL95847.1 unnamed protein product [Vitrella brassicaformis CCMP3155]